MQNTVLSALTCTKKYRLTSTVGLILGPAYLLLFYFILFYFYFHTFYDSTGYLECYLGCVFVVFLCFYFHLSVFSVYRVLCIRF